MFTRLLTALLMAAALLGMPGIAHAARYWISDELTDVAEADRASVAAPAPVQLIFQFKTNGAANARATNFLKNQIRDWVTSSGAFSEVSTDPVANGAILSITIENIADTQAAARQGFATGLTFGLHGTTVLDHYVATAEFVRTSGADVISKEVHHTLITTMGNTETPTNATQVRNANEAVTTIMRQMVGHLINDTARDPGFTGAAPPAAAEATPVSADLPAAASASTSEVPAPAPQPEPAH